MEVMSAQLGISGLLDILPSKVSSGERQRANILHATIHSPRVILADEPTGALHPAAAEQVMDLFQSFSKELSSTLIISTHDIELARRKGFSVVQAQTFDAGANTHQTTFTLQ